MRGKLNWPVELPRHGIGCKSKMAWLTGEEPYGNTQEEGSDEEFEVRALFIFMFFPPV